jgi:hypothetical protein
MKLFRRTFPALITLALLFALCAQGSRVNVVSAAASQSQQKYRVFCVNGKVDFGNRSLQEMQWDYGKSVCQLGEFGSYREAKEDARRRGGVGARCNCQ